MKLNEKLNLLSPGMNRRNEGSLTKGRSQDRNQQKNFSRTSISHSNDSQSHRTKLLKNISPTATPKGIGSQGLLGRGSSGSRDSKLVQMPASLRKSAVTSITLNDSAKNRDKYSESSSGLSSHNKNDETSAFKDITDGFTSKIRSNVYAPMSHSQISVVPRNLTEVAGDKKEARVLFFQKQTSNPSHETNVQVIVEKSNRQYDPQFDQSRRTSNENIDIERYMNEFCFQPVLSLQKHKDEARDNAAKNSAVPINQYLQLSSKSASQTKETAGMTQNTLRQSSSDRKSPTNANPWSKKTDTPSNQHTSDRSLGDYEICEEFKYEPRLEIDQLNFFKMKFTSGQTITQPSTDNNNSNQKSKLG